MFLAAEVPAPRLPRSREHAAPAILLRQPEVAFRLDGRRVGRGHRGGAQKSAPRTFREPRLLVVPSGVPENRSWTPVPPTPPGHFLAHGWPLLPSRAMDPPAGDAAAPPAAAPGSRARRRVPGAAREGGRAIGTKAQSRGRARDERGGRCRTCGRRVGAPREGTRRGSGEGEGLEVVRGAIGRGDVYARLDGGDARRRARAFVGGRAGGCRDRARGVVPGVRLRDGDHGGDAGDLRGARRRAPPWTRRKSSWPRRAPSSRRGRVRGTRRRPKCSALWRRSKRRCEDLESRRDALEADLRSERSARSEAEAQSEKLKTEVNDARETIVVAKETETAHPRGGAVGEKRRAHRRLESESADASRSTGTKCPRKRP